MKQEKYEVIGNKDTIYIEDSVKIGKNVIIWQNNIIKGNTVIGDNVTILPNNTISNCKIEENSTIEQSYLEDSIVGKNCAVGPFSRLRPNSIIGDNCKIGNFVEVKNSTIGNGTKASHLTYIGDASIGENCNIGCGAIFVNYNGKEKNKSIVGNNCFIGSNVNVIAPVNIANDSYVCAGTTITVNTNEKDFVIGRCRETIKPNYADKYKKEKK